MKKLTLFMVSALFVGGAFAQVEITSSGEISLPTDNTPIAFRLSNLHAGTTGSLINSNVSFGFGALPSFNLGTPNDPATGALPGVRRGSANTAIGVFTLRNNTTGSDNTAIGFEALRDNTEGNRNTANGFRALWENTAGARNTATGAFALHNNLTGNDNTATGVSALERNTTGSNNTAYGAFALQHNRTGSNSTATGNSALRNNNTGSNNTATGNSALAFNISGSNNTAVGFEALWRNTAGNNTALGAFALRNTTTGSSNTAVGFEALFANTTGSGNIAVGSSALRSNTTGGSNIAIGGSVLRSNTTGSSNIAIGGGALGTNRTGNNNIAIGVQALDWNETGWSNTAIGTMALAENQTGRGNTAVGTQALYFNMGNFNTAVGYSPLAEFHLSTANNSTAIGFDVYITASNQVRIGNSSVTSIGGFRAWSNLSDGRAKTNISRNVPGLDFINRLQPVTYNMDLVAADKLFGIDRTARNSDENSLAESLSQEQLDIMEQSRKTRQKQVNTGFIAQDVAEATRSIGYDFSGVDIDEMGIYSLRYAEFVVPLVRAVQELSAQNEQQQALIQDLQHQINDMRNPGIIRPFSAEADKYGFKFQRYAKRNKRSCFASKRTKSFFSIYADRILLARKCAHSKPDYF